MGPRHRLIQVSSLILPVRTMAVGRTGSISLTATERTEPT
nr:MAG TPA: hypothetical protein [Caudoviricetes sp.]DAO73620.1 MAG TPA: hypothetical protein [Caudoviricetes sp.]